MLSDHTFVNLKIKNLGFLFLILSLCSCTQDETNQGKMTTEPIEKRSAKRDRNKSLYKPSNKFDHINHIRQQSRIRYSEDDGNYPNYFVDYVIEELLEERSHKRYITDRMLLRKLHNEICWNDYVSIVDTLLNGDKIEIELKVQDFEISDHVMTYQDKTNYLIDIDGKYPFGAVYSKQPNAELMYVNLKINGKLLQTAIDQYQNMYEIKFCNFGSYQRITEAYEDGENIYIYLFGGNAADAYFAKLIFDKSNGYIASIIADYVPLSNYASFRDDFIGF